MTDEASTVEPVEELWVFAGTRVTLKDQPAHVWVDGEGKGAELWFAKKGHYSIGGVYKVEVTRHDGDKLTRHGIPRFERALDDRDAQVRWEAKDAAAAADLERIRRERKADADSALDEALKPLVTIAQELRTGAQRDAFAAYIIRKVAKTAW
jgi:hypothetical protein